ncbi:MAG TPA: hypothetical protein DD856_17330 [Sulfobacillus sp.]|nr:hypothetical protein [Sulfobacillus sp.]
MFKITGFQAKQNDVRAGKQTLSRHQRHHESCARNWQNMAGSSAWISSRLAIQGDRAWWQWTPATAWSAS